MAGPIPALGSAAREAADRGDVIGAIRCMREEHGVDLATAKAAVEAYRRGAPGAPAGITVEVPGAAIIALQQGEYIEAVRLTRAACGSGLKEAKEAVDRLLEANDLLRAQHASLAAGRRSCIARGAVAAVVVAILVVAGIALYLL